MKDHHVPIDFLSLYVININNYSRFRQAVILYLCIRQKQNNVHFGWRDAYLNHLRKRIVQIHLTQTEHTL